MSIHHFGLVYIAILNFILTEGSKCPLPDADINTKVEASSLDPGSIATYSCDKGYELFGKDTRTCGTDGKWSGSIPMCATNVAWRKPVSQSSTARGGEGENANDGDKTTVHEGNKCTQTTVEESPWWSVDLLQEYEIEFIRITTRGCCGLEEIQDLEVRIGDSSNLQRNRLCTWHPGPLEKGTTKELKCARPMKGRHVFIQMVGKVGALSLCEVEVYSKEELNKDRCKGDVDLKTLGLFNQTCYEFQISSGGTFEIAKDYCEKRREGSLVHGIEPITHKFLVSELQRLESDMNSKMIWIGVQKEPQFISRTWKWIDGNKVEKPAWGREQPNNYNGEQNCVVLDGSRDWLWNDVGCNLNYLNWICQFKPSCGTPDRKENTTLTIQPTSKDTIAVYKCPVGNKVVGTAERSCTATGFWNGEAPACKYIDCGKPPSIDKGVVSLTDSRTTYEARATYLCAENYTLDGNDTITCGEGRWEPDPPACLYSWCPELRAPDNGKLSVSGKRSGDTATVVCDSGYFLDGEEMLSCELGGTWSGAVPACRYVDCGLPEDLQNGKMTLINSTTYVASEVVYDCEEDFLLEGPSERLCEASGYWSGERPLCKRIDCGEPKIPVGGYVTGYSFEIHSEVQYHCEAGHYMTGQKTRMCTKEGKWSGESPTCTYVDCGRLPPIMKGEIIHLSEVESIFLDSEIEYRCMPNYRLIGFSHRVCQKSGQWSGDTPKCEEIRCDEPEHPKLSRLTVTGNDRRIPLAMTRARGQSSSNVTYKVGSQVTYKCERGHVVDGASIRTCMGNGTWSSQPPECRFVECGEPPYIENGVFRLLSNETFYGAIVTYECNENWKVDGKIRRFCQNNGTWSGPTPQCVEVLCPSLAEDLQDRYQAEDAREIEPWNTELTEKIKTLRTLRIQVDDGDRRINSKAIYKCTEGQRVVGDRARECKQHGVWDRAEPKCEWIYCKKPVDIPNGRIHISGEMLIYGSVVEYFCLPKYALKGLFNRTCTINGTWSGVDPTCLLDDTNLSSFEDNTVDETSNLARGPLDGTLTGSSYTGIYVGVAVSLILALAVGLTLLFFKTREKKVTKSQTSSSTINKPGDSHYPAAMTYGDLNDPTTGNNIYEHIPDDIDIASYANVSPASSFSSTPPRKYKNSMLNNTYANTEDSYGDCVNNSDGRNFAPVNGKVPYHISQRPRMPPPQPPQVPSSFRPSVNVPVSGVTINGVSVNTG